MTHGLFFGRSLQSLALLGCISWGVVACAPPSSHAPSSSESTPGPGATSNQEGPSEPSTEPPDAPTEPAWPAPSDCPNARCFAFASPELATRAWLERTRPLVIGFGEAHAPSGFTGRSTVRRFTEQLLPQLAPLGSALLVELLAPPSDGCESARAAARERSDEITTGQATTNQSEYLELGQRARELGLVPDILRASCADLEAVRDAGELGVIVVMETIARLTASAVEERLARAPLARPLVFAYGGALHNDLIPRPDRESWSYGPRLARATHERYVELDLLVPELVASTSAWQAFAWYPAFEWTRSQPESTWLIEVAPASWALVFPRSPGDATP